MNVLMFTRYFGSGGTEKVILQLCNALIRNGDKPVVCAAAGKGVRLLHEHGIAYYEIEDISSKNPFVMLKTIKTIREIIKSEQIDIVHTHHRMAAFYVRILSIYKEKGFVNTIHNTFSDKRLLTKLSYEKAFNVAVGNSVRQNMADYYHLPENMIITIYNAIDNAFKAEEEPLIEKLKCNGSYLVGNIGRINTQKGMEYFVRACAILKKRAVNAKFLIVGEGVLEEQIKKLVSNLDLSDYVYFYGFSENVLNLMSKMDLVVLSSLWEGFPLTPIETFSVGKTIVATEVPGTLEIVKNNYNGVIVPIKNEEKLAEAIEIVLQNKDLRSMLENNAKATYEEEFSTKVFWRRYQELYDAVLKR